MKGRRGVPRRTCVGCRAVQGQRALIRVWAAAGGLAVDTRPGPGRGAYLCPRLECFQRAWQGKGLARALRRDLTRADRVAVQAAFQAAVDRRGLLAG